MSWMKDTYVSMLHEALIGVDILGEEPIMVLCMHKLNAWMIANDLQDEVSELVEALQKDGFVLTYPIQKGKPTKYTYPTHDE
jgi:hypothetical protein